MIWLCKWHEHDTFKCILFCSKLYTANAMWYVEIKITLISTRKKITADSNYMLGVYVEHYA